MALRLRQGQVWKAPDEFIRIVHLERLEVRYKTMRDLKSGEGEHHTATKKEFCRLLKNCSLLPAKGAEENSISSANEQAPDQPENSTTQPEESQK